MLMPIGTCSSALTYTHTDLPCHASTRYSPFFLLHGCEMRLPLDIVFGLPPDTPTEAGPAASLACHNALENAFDYVRTNMDAAHRRQQSIYDRKARGSRYNTGDLVWLFTPVTKPGTAAKLSSFWTPWVVTKRINDVDYEIRDPTLRAFA